MTEKYIGNYRILEKIGSGGMARVYLAVHKDVPNLKVVLKVLFDPSLAERFKQEADKLALLDNHPNICKIKHFFNHGDEFVIAMEYIEGRSLEEILEEKVKLPVPESLEIILDILSALAPAHKQGICHRDIKPGNIMLKDEGPLKIIDFGIAKSKSDPNLTIPGTCAGTPQYMAPEQFESCEDADYVRSDIYAVGTMLYRMLTGELPFKGDNEFALRDAKMFEKPEKPSRLNGDITKELDNIILKSIDADLEKRYGSVEEMGEELQRVYDGYIVKIPEKELREELKKPRQKKGSSRFVYVAVAVVVIAAAAFGAWRLFGPGGGDRDLSGEGGSSESGIAFMADSVASGDEGMADIAESSGEEETRVKDTEEATPEDTRKGEGDTRDAITATETAEKTSEKETVKVANGTIRVGSRPVGGADIYINGKLTPYKTPYNFSMSPGEYTVRIVLSYEGQVYDRTYTVKVESGESKKVLMEL